MNRKVIKLLLFVVILCPVAARAQTPPAPLTSRELVALVYQLPKHPELRDEVVEEIRKRGIGFPLTDGMRSLVATKSGSDALLRRTLEEAERRRVNPTASARPPDAEAQELLDRTRTATLAAATAMPDFIVKQLIKRSRAYGTTNNWIPQDNLTIAVAYRANGGEQYKVLAVNGMPLGQEAKETRDYTKDVAPGATSSGAKHSVQTWTGERGTSVPHSRHLRPFNLSMASPSVGDLSPGMNRTIRARCSRITDRASNFSY